MPITCPPRVIPPSVLADLAVRMLLHRRGSFHAHARRMVANLNRPPLVLGGENIPRSGPVVITTNHFYRPGFFIPWLAAAISAQIEQEITWLMTGVWTFPGHPLAPLFEGLMGRVLRGVAGVYGFYTMPPMPPRPQDAPERAASVMRLLRFARRNPGAILGLAPEGGDSLTGVLTMPPEGSGRLMLALAHMGFCFLPVGVYEADDRLVVCFDAAYRLELGAEDRAAADLQARGIVMDRIAACLPDQLRGEFARKA